MNQFQAMWSTVAKKASAGRSDQEQSNGGGEDATVKAAEAISKIVLHRELASTEKTWAGPAVHYAFGTLLGAAYGLLADSLPVNGPRLGAVYGAAVWLLADEIGVPALGFAPPPSEVPVTSHVKALASHLVYGIATEAGRRSVLWAVRE
jgi:putative membrane protein